MTRAFCIPGIIFLFCAFVLSFLTSISLPYLTGLDIARTTVVNAGRVGGEGVKQIRLGIWAPCSYQTDNARTCEDASHGYTLFIQNSDRTETVDIGSSWTRGLAVHPVATAVTFIALLMSFSQHVTVTLFASLTSFLAAFLTLIAFACDIALLVYLKHQVNKLNDLDPTTKAGPGFWLTFVSLILLLLAGCTVCFGRRKARLSGASSYPSYPMSSTKKPFWQRFRRN
ncbi:hypothetical protein EDD18DRAFT_1159766 [Armillaria luteobubalina]|uniref:Pali-domain-containing protein n=1 Tax=Armillaria luteobubalina TaxID=153913 RepID=A0AA39Q7T2_9AGAR|nr:hypothetical protein EDD18DRAFT_1159766 [Armillaria luteobubalina]